jgi:hypothetical protein
LARRFIAHFTDITGNQPRRQCAVAEIGGRNAYPRGSVDQFRIVHDLD